MSIAFKDGSELNSEEWSTREQILRRFEAAWHGGTQPQVEDYLPADEPMRPSVLVELVHVDLEYRLKRGQKARGEQYLDRFPELESDPAAKLELITAELEMRRRLEPGLALDEFLARFHRYDAELRSTVLDRIVALKILHEAHQDSPAAVDRFLREARAAAQLDHPHIVRIVDFDRDVKTC
jgi:serine/threonine protein kinase